MTPGEKPVGAPVTVTVPLMVPGHELELPDDPELPEHLVVESSRWARLPRPMPEATWGRTVTRSTKPATAIITNRICFRQRVMARPSSLADAAAPALGAHATQGVPGMADSPKQGLRPWSARRFRHNRAR